MSTTHPSDLRTFALLCLGMLTGCPASRGTPPPARAGTTMDPPVINITRAPDADQFLESGHFEIEGEVTADAGLHSGTPLLLQVIDATTGLISEANIAPLVVQRAEELPGTSSFNTSTGEFVIDGLDDFVADAGERTLRLVARDTLDQETTWSVNVEFGAFWSPTSAEIGEAREVYLDQLRDGVVAYRDAVAGLSFESPFDWVALDQDYIELLVAYLAYRVADPTSGQAQEIGFTFEDHVGAFLAEAGDPQDLTESGYRTEMLKAAGWERYRAELAQSRAVNSQLEVAPPATDGLDDRDEDLAFYQHTFVATTLEPPDPEAEQFNTVFSLVIYMDDGTPVPLREIQTPWDPEEIEEDTADPESPAFALTVTFVDGDEDGLIDDLLLEGYDVNANTNEPVPFDETAHYNHVMGPLRVLSYSPYTYY